MKVVSTIDARTAPTQGVPMPLTPADVHNIAFKKPTIGKRGYDEEQVDAFLDALEQELVRLIEENHQLRAVVARGGPNSTPPSDTRAVDEMAALLDRVQRDRAAAEESARAAPGELDQAHTQGPGP